MRRCMTVRVWCARCVFATRSEEVFDFGKTDMTSAKIEHLKKTLNAEFAQIFQLCEYILRYAAALPRAAVGCLCTPPYLVLWLRRAATPQRRSC